MPAFIYRAVDSGGKPIHGELQAASNRIALDEITSRGLIPIRVSEKQEGLWARLNEPLGAGRKIRFPELVNLTRALAKLLGARVGIERALVILIEARDPGPERVLLEGLLKGVKKGGSLAGVMTRDPKTFPAFYVNMVRAGEVSGDLEATFARLTATLERNLHFRNEIRSALIYPTILMVLIAVTLVMVVTIVLPEFETLFASAGAELPAATRMVMGFGAIVTEGWWVMLFLGLGIAGAGSYYLRKPPIRLRFDRALIPVGFLGRVIVRGEMVRFLRTLGTMLGQGIALDQAWAVSVRVVTNRAIAADLSGAIEGIKRGERAAKILGGFGYIPPTALQLLRVGEETGSLAGVMVDAAAILEDEQALTIKHFLTIFTPAVTLFLGGIVAAFVAAVLFGILSINDLAI